MLFSLLMYTIITIYGRVKKSVMPLFIFWIIFLLDLELNFIGKLRGSCKKFCHWVRITSVLRIGIPMGTNVLLLLQICFFFVTREIS